MISFWCKKCKKDVDAPAYKKTVLGSDYFQGKCVFGSRVIRFITNPSEDPYYFQSKRVRIQRERYAKDLIQPGEDGFQTFYRKEWEKLEKAKEEYEKKQLMKKQERDKFYNRFKGSGYQDIVKKVVEREAAM